MFVFDRSALAVVVPLALLVAVVLWSNRGQPLAVRGQQAYTTAQAPADNQTVAANLPSR